MPNVNTENEIIAFNSKNEEYKWLSNMYEIPGGIVVPILNETGEKYDIKFSCVESAFQAYKCFSGLGKIKTHPESEIKSFQTFSCLNGFEARKAGKNVPNLDIQTWEKNKLTLMKFLIKLKFRNPELEKKLIATDGKELIEDSPWGDNFWGTKNGIGENNLGKILMEERTRALSELTKERITENNSLSGKTKGSRFYAGVGSRRTPPEILAYMKDVAGKLEKRGYTLQSGGAEGADSAFASGVEDSKNIRVVTPGFEPCKGKVSYQSTPEGIASVDIFHQNPSRLKPFARQLMERNYYQVMGNPLAGMGKVDFVLCWAPVKPDGTCQYYGKDDERNTGGTGQAIKIAMANNIPVYNLYLSGVAEKFEKEVLESDSNSRVMTQRKSLSKPASNERSNKNPAGHEENKVDFPTFENEEFKPINVFPDNNRTAVRQNDREKGSSSRNY